MVVGFLQFGFELYFHASLEMAEEVEETAPMEECRIPVNGQPIVFEPSDALKNLYQDHPSTQVSF